MRKLVWLKVNWLTVLDIVKTIMIGILLFASINLLAHVANQTHQIKSLSQQNRSLTLQNNGLSKQIKQSNLDIKSHIDCIISFFGLPNRQSLSISSVCHFQPSAIVVEGSTNAPQESSGGSTSGASPGTSSKSQSQNTANTPASQANTPQPKPQPQPSPLPSVAHQTTTFLKMLVRSLAP